MKKSIIAQTVHEALRAWIKSVEGRDSPTWETESAASRTRTLASVNFVLANPDADDRAQHDQWMAQMLNAGWRLGPERNEFLKTHPSLVPFEALSETEKRKDTLLRVITLALADMAD